MNSAGKLPGKLHRARDTEPGLWSSVAEVEAYYDRYFSRVYAYFIRRVGLASRAEDLTSETFERILRAAPDFRVRGDPEIAVRVWTYRIAGNVFRNYVRSKKREATRVGRWQRHQLSTAEGPEFESSVALADAIGALPLDDQEILALRYWDGLTAPEIASVVGCRQRQVYSALDRCIRHLRRQLSAPARETTRETTHVASALP